MCKFSTVDLLEMTTKGDIFEDVLYGWSLPKNQSSIIEKGSGVPLDRLPGGLRRRSMPSFLLSLYLQGDLKQKEKEAQREEDENFGDSWVGQTRTWLWKTMEYPWTSKLAQVNRGCSLLGFVGESTQPSAQLCTLLLKLRKL